MEQSDMRSSKRRRRAELDVYEVARVEVGWGRMAESIEHGENTFMQGSDQNNRTDY